MATAEVRRNQIPEVLQVQLTECPRTKDTTGEDEASQTTLWFWPELRKRVTGHLKEKASQVFGGQDIGSWPPGKRAEPGPGSSSQLLGITRPCALCQGNNQTLSCSTCTSKFLPT